MRPLFYLPNVRVIKEEKKFQRFPRAWCISNSLEVNWRKFAVDPSNVGIYRAQILSAPLFHLAKFSFMRKDRL